MFGSLFKERFVKFTTVGNVVEQDLVTASINCIQCTYIWKNKVNENIFQPISTLIWYYIIKSYKYQIVSLPGSGMSSFFLQTGHIRIGDYLVRQTLILSEEVEKESNFK